MIYKEHEKGREGNQDCRKPFPCEHCGSNTREDVVKAAIWGSRGLVVIENIPAWMCEGCGEQFYDEETAREIEKIVAGPAGKAKQEILVPVFSLAEVEVPQKKCRPPEDVHDWEAEAIQSMYTGMEQGRQEGEGNQESQKAWRCRYCEADTHEDVVRSVLWAERGLVAVEDIPARVCEGCGERFYDEETTQRIEKVVGDATMKAKREIRAPVFSLPALACRNGHDQ